MVQVQDMVRGLERVEARLLEIVRRDPPPRAAVSLIRAGGKRIRPALVLLAARACGGSEEEALEPAVASELVHTATLLHDDVIDASPVRRGAAAAWVTEGTAASVLAGDFWLTQAFGEVLRSPHAPILFPRLVGVLNRMVSAEMRQLSLTRRARPVQPGVCLSIARSKTGALFEWAGFAGAVCAGAPPTLRQAMAVYGREVGLAFQVTDDLLDLFDTSAEALDNLRHELASGSASLAVALGMKRRPDLKDTVRAAAVGDREAAKVLVRQLARSGVAPEARRVAQSAVRRALKALDAVPRSAARTALAKAAHQAVSRAA